MQLPKKYFIFNKEKIYIPTVDDENRLNDLEYEQNELRLEQLLNQIKQRDILEKIPEIKSNVNNTLKGGSSGINTANEQTLSVFPINADTIRNFRRFFTHNSSKDCVISALQLIGVFDIFTANVLRITSSGLNGMSKEELLTILMFRFNKRFNFQEYYNDGIATNPQGGYVNFLNHLKLIFRPADLNNTSIICGINKVVSRFRIDSNGSNKIAVRVGDSINIKHVFLIYSDGTKLTKLDPQIPSATFDLGLISDPVTIHPNNDIITRVSADRYNPTTDGPQTSTIPTIEIQHQVTSYMLMYNYPNNLTDAEKLALGFSSY